MNAKWKYMPCFVMMKMKIRGTKEKKERKEKDGKEKWGP